VLRRTARVDDIWLTEHYFAGESVYNDALLFAFSVPWAKRSGPERARGVGELGTILGMSGRTLARRFEEEVGMSMRACRRRLRLLSGSNCGRAT
jgi:AraC-like DNA-binding protein